MTPKDKLRTAFRRVFSDLEDGELDLLAQDFLAGLLLHLASQTQDLPMADRAKVAETLKEGPAATLEALKIAYGAKWEAHLAQETGSVLSDYLAAVGIATKSA
jgi:hypothetical protein